MNWGHTLIAPPVGDWRHLCLSVCPLAVCPLAEKMRVSLQIPSAEYALGAVSQANGGNIDLVRAMGEAARDTLNGLIAVVTYGDESARVSNTSSPTQRYGHTGGQLWV